ncbi:MAG: class I SAM-dependent methyltransferase [Dehalococcoidia bacterium]
MAEQEGFAWQSSIWDRMAETYLREIDAQFAPVVEQVLTWAGLRPGERVLDLGTGTGSVAVRAATLVASEGDVLGVDPSGEMIAVAEQRAAAAGLNNVTFRQGRGESIPAADGAFDVVLASLSLMYAIDRRAAAREIARVLRPGGRLVAAVWAGPEECDIVRFQQIAGRFAPPPPVADVGPGALGDPSRFLAVLAEAGIETAVERETLGFKFPNFDLAWEVLAGVTTAGLPRERQAEARAAVMEAMWPESGAPHEFRNVTQFIVGRRIH